MGLATSELSNYDKKLLSFLYPGSLFKFDMYQNILTTLLLVVIGIGCYYLQMFHFCGKLCQMSLVDCYQITTDNKFNMLGSLIGFMFRKTT